MSRFDPSWFRSFYRQTYLDSVAGVLSEQRTQSEVDSILSWSGLSPPARVADLGCGTGRHTCALARRGFSVTGIDQSPDFIARARAACDADGADFVVGDVRDPLSESFDLLLSLFHSFGFFSDRENASTLTMWASHLARGGCLVLDVWNREMIEARFEPEWTWEPAAGLLVRERRRLDSDAGRLTVRYAYEYADGNRYEASAWFRLYSRDELRLMLVESGLRIRSVWGSLAGERWSAGSRSTAIVAERA